jgi:NADPH2:quinone reductase
VDPSKKINSFYLKDRAVLLPDNVSLESGAALLLQGLTAYGMTQMVYTVKSGDTVLIHVI